MSEELTQLKERADQLGIQYKANIGIEALRNKVNAALVGGDSNKPDDEDEQDDGDSKSDDSVKPAASKPESLQEMRDRIIAEATKLVRCRITCLNPQKAHSKGEVITVGNKFTGSISKFVPYGEATDEGFHIPQIIFDELNQRKFNSVRSEKGKNGVYHPVQRLVKEYALEILPQLTQEELERLARTQAAAAGL